MKVKVVNVVDQAFTGKDGATVASARLVYELDGKQKALDTYIPPVVTAALAWKPGDEVEIEEYEDKNGKARFKTPQAGGRKGFGGGLSYEDRARLDATLAERMDRRTALMTAQEATEISARILPLAEEMYQWLRKTASGSEARTPSLGGPESAGAGVPRSSPSPASVPSVEAGTPPERARASVTSGSDEAPPASTASSEASEAHKGVPSAPTSTPASEPSEVGGNELGEGSEPPASTKRKCPHATWSAAPREGWELCDSCGNARKAAA